MNLFLRCNFLAVLLLCLAGCAQKEKETFPPNTEPLTSVSIKSLDGKIFSVHDVIKKHRANVFYFLMPGCPMCESYTRSINELDKKFSDKNISFFGIFSSGYYSDEEIISYRNDFKVEIPFYRDIDFKLTHALQATVTPQVFVLDSTANLLYSGSIDNWAYGTGKKRMEATEFFLDDALENIIKGRPVAVKSTRAYGCIIDNR